MRHNWSRKKEIPFFCQVFSLSRFFFSLDSFTTDIFFKKVRELCVVTHEPVFFSFGQTGWVELVNKRVPILWPGRDPFDTKRAQVLTGIWRHETNRTPAVTVKMSPHADALTLSSNRSPTYWIANYMTLPAAHSQACRITRPTRHPRWLPRGAGDFLFFLDKPFLGALFCLS